jgi:hypothetical protein
VVVGQCQHDVVEAVDIEHQVVAGAEARHPSEGHQLLRLAGAADGEAVEQDRSSSDLRAPGQRSQQGLASTVAQL